jgi:hypothetical protein
MRNAYLEAVASLVRAQKYRVLPADLLYFGGDDLVLTLPHRDAKTFLEAFDIALRRLSPLPNLRFTWAALSFELQAVDHQDRNASLDRSATAIRELNRLLVLAKQQRDGVIPTAKATSSLQELRWCCLQNSQGLFAELGNPPSG